MTGPKLEHGHPGKRRPEGPRVRAAWLVMVGLVVAALATSSDLRRSDRIDDTRAWASPTLTCFTGYDESGRCVAWSIAGGVHSFLVPGLLAALIVGAGGTLFGVLQGHGAQGTRRLSRGVMGMLEALPRLVLLVLAFSLSGYSMTMVGIALGLLGMPALASEVAMRFDQLEDTDYMASTRAHGLGMGRIILYHGLLLSCSGDIVRRMVLTFGQMMVADTTLTYVLGKNLSGATMSWGYQLHRSLDCLYDTLWALEDFLNRGSTAIPWYQGWCQFLSIMLAVLAVLWATLVLGETAAQRMERST